MKQILVVHNLDNYKKYDAGIGRIEVKSIKNLLDKNNVPFSTVIVDDDFINILNYSYCEQAMIISEDEERCLFLCILSAEKVKFPKIIDEGTKKYLFRNLLKENQPVKYYIFGETIRRYMSGIREYEPICTTQIQSGIGGSRYYLGGSGIIFPVTTKQWESYKNLPVEKFVEVISSCQEFSNLVDHVYEYPIEKGKYSKEEIRKCYKEFMREMYAICKEEN